MKCYTVDGSGLDSLKLKEGPGPGELKPGEALVDVRAVSLNYRDLMVADGRYSGRQDPPIIACSDMAGVVAKVAADVTELRVGDRVLNAPFRCWPAGKLRPEWARTFGGGASVDGVLAEQVAYRAASLIKIPGHLDFAEGATFTVAGLTAWAAIVTHGHVKPADWILLHGTGGVSIFGAQIAKLFSARTIMSTSSEAKARLVRDEFGVDETVDYRDDKWPEQVRKITGGRGADIVVEVAGGNVFPKSIMACASGGHIAMIGVLAGPVSEVNVVQILMRQVTIRGVMMESTEELRALVKAYDVAKLRPRVDKAFPFEAAREAYEYLKAQQHIGKVVIAVKR